MCCSSDPEIAGSSPARIAVSADCQSLRWKTLSSSTVQFFQSDIGSCGLVDNVLFLRAIHCQVLPGSLCLQTARTSPKRIPGSCGLMDKALVLGTKDCRFESCQDHLFLDNF